MKSSPLIAILVVFALGSSTQTFGASHKLVIRNEKAPQIKLRPMNDGEQIEADRQTHGEQSRTLGLKFRVVSEDLKEELEGNPNCHVAPLQGTALFLAGCTVRLAPAALIDPTFLLKITVGAFALATVVVILVQVGQTAHHPSLNGTRQWADDAQLRGHEPFAAIGQMLTLPRQLPPPGAYGESERFVTQPFSYPLPYAFHSEGQGAIDLNPAEKEVVRILGGLALDGTLQKSLGEAGLPVTEEAKNDVETALSGLSGEAADIAQDFVNGCMTAADVRDNIRAEIADAETQAEPLPKGLSRREEIRLRIYRALIGERPKVIQRIGDAIGKRGFQADARLDEVARRIFTNAAHLRRYWAGK